MGNYGVLLGHGSIELIELIPITTLHYRMHVLN